MVADPRFFSDKSVVCLTCKKQIKATIPTAAVDLRVDDLLTGFLIGKSAICVNCLKQLKASLDLISRG